MNTFLADSDSAHFGLFCMNPANSSMSSTARRRRPCEDIEDIYANVVCSDEIRAGEQMMQEVIPPPISRRQKWNFLVSFLEEVP